MVLQWQKWFSSYVGKGSHPVRVYQITVDDLLDNLSVDAIVSPANSFGFMDGGIDAAYSRAFPGVQQRVQKAISDVYNGELPVGMAHIVWTGITKQVPMELIVAPTMRTPCGLSNELAINCYLATRAVFVESLNTYGDLNTIAIPGMGTGCGGLPVDFVAKCMLKAYEDVLLNTFEFPKSLADAGNVHREIMSWLN